MSLALVLLLSIQSAVPLDKVVKQTFGAGGKTRGYYLLVPARATAEAPAPMLVLLHGSGREGRSLAEPWSALAREQGIILVAPDSTRREGWAMREDGPDFLYALVEMLRVQYPVDPRRIYLFGHSAGAIHALSVAVLESEYFAAAAVHAGVVSEGVMVFLDRAPRKVPIGIWVGTNDSLFPLPSVRASRDALASRGFPASLTEIPGHTHAYYDRALAINRQAWSFLEKHALGDDPKFQKHETR